MMENVSVSRFYEVICIIFTGKMYLGSTEIAKWWNIETGR